VDVYKDFCKNGGQTFDIDDDDSSDDEGDVSLDSLKREFERNFTIERRVEEEEEESDDSADEEELKDNEDDDDNEDDSSEECKHIEEHDEERKQPAGDDAEKDICKICFVNSINCVVIPCGHFANCLDCGKRLKKCPICRINVMKMQEVFRA